MLWTGSICRRRAPRREAGLTLLEVLVTLGVLGVLAAFAVPTWQQHRITLRRVEARAELLATVQRLEACRTSLAVYDNPACTVALPLLTALGSYRVEGQVTAQAFQLTAKPVGEQLGDACGEFSVDHVGTRGVSGSIPSGECWGPED
jgi:type IV pilus assembly protein PilE